MNKLELNDALRSYCESNGIIYIPSETDWQNLINQEIAPDKLVLLTDFILTPSFNMGGRVEECSYSGTMFLCKKAETAGTRADFDETFEQKYDARLKQLTANICQILREVTCQNEGEVASCQITYRINQYSEIVDGVWCDVVLNF